MASLNRAELIGYLGKDPEVRSFQSGGKVCNLSIATTDRWTDKTTGEVKDRTEWHRVAVFNEKLVEIAERFLIKGSKVYIEGQIETRKWQDKDGVEKYSTEIVLRNYAGKIIMLDGKSDSADATRPAPTKSSAPAAAKYDLDDEIPF